MIHYVSSRKSKIIPFDEDALQSKEGRNYNRVIVKKPWGYEYLAFQNKHVAIWMLHLVRKRRTSMHCHPRKKTALVLLSGQAKVRHLNGSIALNAMDGVLIDRNVFHSTEAVSALDMNPQSENGIWVMEIESPPRKEDLIRLKDSYGRAGASYEGTEHLVEEAKACLNFKEPQPGKVSRQKFFDCTFTLCKGTFFSRGYSEDALVSAVSKKGKDISSHPLLSIGGLSSIKDFREKFSDQDLKDYTFLIMEREKKVMRVADYIFSAIADLGVKDVFAVSGGGAMHLVDALGNNKKLNYIAVYHEQAAAMAAEGYARISEKPGVALVTSGPGGTNTITGVCGAWIDSIPTIFISGQVTRNMLLEKTGLRQFGIQESDIISLVKPITKYAVTVKDPKTIRYHLEKAIYEATTRRPGPVWLDIPLDVQSELINPDELDGFKAKAPGKEEALKKQNYLKKNIKECIALLKKAKRPVLIAGYGIRLSRCEDKFLEFVKALGIPVISSWTASDLIPFAHPFYVGRSGIMGDRAGNFAVQNADLLLILGSRMSVPHVGYNFKVFARAAKKIMVDIDAVELKKTSLKPDLPIESDAKEFIDEFMQQCGKKALRTKIKSWLSRCRGWKKKYPVVLPEYKSIKKDVNSFYFVDVLSEKMDDKAVVVTDMGTSFTCTMQTFKPKKGQRLFTSSGHASMGFGLPGAIGACLAAGRKTICVSGDGGLQMNIQEFQTLAHYKVPVILFVLNNKGYLTIKLMQQNHFGKYVGSDHSSGVGTPDFVKVAKAYGIKATRISNHEQLHKKIDRILAEPGPFVCEIMMPEDQALIPRVSSFKKPDGTIIAKPLEDLYPFLDRKEFKKNMIVKPIEPLK